MPCFRSPLHTGSTCRCATFPPLHAESAQLGVSAGVHWSWSLARGDQWRQGSSRPAHPTKFRPEAPLLNVNMNSPLSRWGMTFSFVRGIAMRWASLGPARLCPRDCGSCARDRTLDWSRMKGQTKKPHTRSVQILNSLSAGLTLFDDCCC